MGQIERLIEDRKNWETKVVVRKDEYDYYKREVKQKEKELKEAKSNSYQAYKLWREARVKVEQLKNKISALPSRVRRWNKDNIGKVLESFEK